MFAKETRQVRRARERAMVRRSMTATERRDLFRRPRPERREIFNSLLSMILNGDLRISA
jgi:hypothetical protein